MKFAKIRPRIVIIRAIGPPREAESVLGISTIPIKALFPIGIAKCASDTKIFKAADTTPIAMVIQIVFLAFN